MLSSQQITIGKIYAAKLIYESFKEMKRRRGSSTSTETVRAVSYLIIHRCCVLIKFGIDKDAGTAAHWACGRPQGKPLFPADGDYFGDPFFLHMPSNPFCNAPCIFDYGKMRKHAEPPVSSLLSMKFSSFG